MLDIGRAIRMKSLSVVSFVVCDDVRREVTGKETLVGAYGSEISISHAPARISLAFWCEIVPKIAGDIFVEAMLTLPGNQRSVARLTAADSVAGVPMSLCLPQSIFSIPEGGDIVFALRDDPAGGWETVKRKKIVVVAPEGVAPRPGKVRTTGQSDMTVPSGRMRRAGRNSR